LQKSIIPRWTVSTLSAGEFTADFGPFDSYLSAYVLVEEKGGEIYEF
jgi:hypothetical protein